MVELMTVSTTDDAHGILIDSGASNHMVSDSSRLVDVEEVNDLVVRIASGDLLPVTQKGVFVVNEHRFELSKRAFVSKRVEC